MTKDKRTKASDVKVDPDLVDLLNKPFPRLSEEVEAKVKAHRETYNRRIKEKDENYE